MKVNDTCVPVCMSVQVWMPRIVLGGAESVGLPGPNCQRSRDVTVSFFKKNIEKHFKKKLRFAEKKLRGVPKKLRGVETLLTTQFHRM